MLPVTIWMNMPSFYQSDFFRALVHTNAIDLQVIYARGLTPDRIQLGWHADLKGFNYRTLSAPHALHEAARLAGAQRERLHIVNGIWAEPTFVAALLCLIIAKSRYALYMEAPDPYAARSKLKRWLRSTFGKLVCARASGAFPIGGFGIEFLAGLGLPRDRMYPFGYFRSMPAGPLEGFETSDQLEIVYVGQLVHRKGLDLLLTALAPLRQAFPCLRLTLIGHGVEQSFLEMQARSLGMTHWVNFEGALSYEHILSRLHTASALVLPSRWDGWGLVVNEALMAGVPAIVSDRCGAADLIRDGVNGYIFRGEDVADLQSKLTLVLQQHDFPTLRRRARQVGQVLSTDHIASYFIECLEHMLGLAHERPPVPWHLALGSEV